MIRCRAGATVLVAAALVPWAQPVWGQDLLLAVGDSITMGLGDAQRLGYPGRLQRQLAESGVTATVTNLGVDGETTAEGLARIDVVLLEPADALLLMEGTNDISLGVSMETIRFNLDEMAQRAASAGVEPVHATVIPRLPGDRDDGDNVGARALASALRRLAWERERRLADPFDILTSRPGGYDDLYLGGTDFWHLNDQGYELLAGIFHDLLLGIDTSPPLVDAYEPGDDGQEIPGTSVFVVELYDFGTGIDLAQTLISLNGQPVDAVISGDETHLRLEYQPTQPLVGEIVFAVTSADRADPPNLLSRALGTYLVAGTTFLAGDLDRTGRVDGRDLVVFARSFGSREGDARFLPLADFDENGVIDGLDLAVLAADFGQSSF